MRDRPLSNIGMIIETNSLTIFGKEIPFYGLLFVFGFVVAVLTALPKAHKMGLPFSEVACSGVFAGVGGILGSKILSVLTSIRLIVQYKIPFLDLLQNGFVFYGGLIGGALGLLVYAKAFHAPLLPYLDLFAAGTALGHAVGRIGCLFSGCCYGIPTTGAFSVVYLRAVDPNTPLNTPLLPIQLIESVCLAALFLVCEAVFYGTKRRGISALVYAATYAVLRFVLEFFRGDPVRGILGVFSTSQYISIAILIFCAGCLIFALRKKTAGTPPAAQK